MRGREEKTQGEEAASEPGPGSGTEGDSDVACLLANLTKKMAFFGLLSSLMETAMEMHDELISAVESESDNRPAEVACEVGGGEGRNAGEVPAAGVPEHQVDQERSYIPAPSQPRLNDESEPEKFEVSDVNESSDL
jgi:hypothetical protein